MIYIANAARLNSTSGPTGIKSAALGLREDQFAQMYLVAIRQPDGRFQLVKSRYTTHETGTIVDADEFHHIMAKTYPKPIPRQEGGSRAAKLPPVVASERTELVVIRTEANDCSVGFFNLEDRWWYRVSATHRPQKVGQVVAWWKIETAADLGEEEARSIAYGSEATVLRGTEATGICEPLTLPDWVGTLKVVQQLEGLTPGAKQDIQGMIDRLSYVDQLCEQAQSARFVLERLGVALRAIVNDAERAEPIGPAPNHNHAKPITLFRLNEAKQAAQLYSQWCTNAEGASVTRTVAELVSASRHLEGVEGSGRLKVAVRAVAKLAGVTVA